MAGKEQYLLNDLFKAFDFIERNHRSDVILRKDLFSFMRAQHVLNYHLTYLEQLCLILSWLLALVKLSSMTVYFSEEEKSYIKSQTQTQKVR